MPSICGIGDMYEELHLALSLLVDSGCEPMICGVDIAGWIHWFSSCMLKFMSKVEEVI